MCRGIAGHTRNPPDVRMPASIQAPGGRLECPTQESCETREILQGERRRQRRKVRIGFAAEALHQLASLRGQIPSPVLLIDQARIARR
jgi:hypothetical protein